MKTRWHKVLVILSATLLLIVYPRVRVGMSNVACGQIITQSVTLTGDLVCPESINPVLDVISNDITIDLGGHTIKLQSPVFVSSGEPHGIVVRDAKNITITNGTLEGFGTAIGIYQSSDLTLRQLTIRHANNLDEDQYLRGIFFLNSHDALVENSRFEFDPGLFHRDAVNFASSQGVVQNITSVGGHYQYRW